MPVTRSDLVPTLAPLLPPRPALGALLRLRPLPPSSPRRRRALSVNQPTRSGLSEIGARPASGQLAPDVPTSISVTAAHGRRHGPQRHRAGDCARGRDGTAAVGYQLLPFANGRRWGAHERTGANGEAVFHIPLPRPGPTEIRSQRPWYPQSRTTLSIWHGPQNVPGPVWMQKTFALSAEPQSGSLWVAADDAATVYLNGTPGLPTRAALEDNCADRVGGLGHSAEV